MADKMSAHWNELPGPADVEYFTQAQAGAWGDMLRAFARFVGPVDGRRVLDVGSGPGLLPRLFAQSGARLSVACDDSLDMLRRAASLAQDESPIQMLGGAALGLPLAEGCLDCAVASNLLFLLPDPQAGLLELARVVRHGGLVACLNPSAAMSMPAAEQFARQRSLEGFGLASFINYARLAEGHHRLDEETWRAAAAGARITDLRFETRAAGLVLLFRGAVQRPVRDGA